MSAPEWSLTIAPTAAEYQEAMARAGARLYRGGARVKLVLYGLFYGFFAPLGATLVAWVLWIIFALSGEPELGDLPGPALPVTVVIFGLLAFWLMRQVQFTIARACARSAFGSRYDLSLSQSGMTLTTAHSRWHTGWADVEAVAESKNTLAICISGIVIPVPRRAFLGPADANTALAQMRDWRAAR